MLLHQGLGLPAFNELPPQRAFHAVYECSNSVVLAGHLTRGRPFPDRESLLQRADDLLAALAEESIDALLEAYPRLGWRPGDRAAMRRELARIARDRLERMLGPEGGYDNWA